MVCPHAGARAGNVGTLSSGNDLVCAQSGAEGETKSAKFAHHGLLYIQSVTLLVGCPQANRCRGLAVFL